MFCVSGRVKFLVSANLRIILIVLVFALSAYAANLDRSFATNGRFTTSVPGGTSGGGYVFTQPSGRIVSIYGIYTGGAIFYINIIQIAGLNRSGVLDSSFGTSGRIGIGSPGGYWSYSLLGTAMQPDGKILIGYSASAPDAGTNYSLFRLTADGDFDPTFSATVPSIPNVGSDVVLGADGKVTIVAYNGSSAFNLIRYNPDGTRDEAFGPGGVKALPFTRLRGTMVGAILDEKGKLTIGFNDGSVIRFDNDGNLDHGFGRQGVAVPYAGAGASLQFSRMLRQTDGKFLFSGTKLIRYTSRGRPDAAFGTNGLVDTQVVPGATGSRAAVQADGRIVVVGNIVPTNSTQRLLIERFTNDGTLERFTKAAFSDFQTSSGGSVAIQPDGKIIVVGGASPPTYNGFFSTLVILRLKPDFADGALAKLCDFDGDGRTDLSVYRRDPGGTGQSLWDIRTWSGQSIQTSFGTSEDIPVPQDYENDGKTDVAVFRPSNGIWYYKTDINSDDFVAVQFGQMGDIPIPNDFDGDGKADLAVFRPSTATWYILNSSDGSVTTNQFGDPSETPVTGDFDGDGKADLALWNSLTATFRVLRSSDGVVRFPIVGGVGYTPVIADYDGDRISELAVNGNGFWIYVRSSDAQSVGTNWSGIPVPGDYNGDGLAEIASYSGTSALTWRLANSTNIQFGQSGDIPLPGR